MALRAFAQFFEGKSLVTQGVALAAPVADLAGDDQALLVELDGRARLAEVGVGDAEVAQGVALAAPVADLAGDDQPLLVELDGALRVSPRSA